MSIVRLAWAYLAARPLLTALHVVMLAMGVGTMVLLVLFTAQTEDRLARDAAPVDLVVGAKGSPLQLIMSAVLHVDVPTGNVPLAEARKVAGHPMVALATPIALGDSHRGFRIVGSDASFLALYGAKVATGSAWSAPLEAVIGADVARRLALAPGSEFAGTHGLAAGGSPHAAHPYKVVGVLAPTGAVIDRLIVTSLESVWQLHDREGDITALLIRYRTPLAAATLPRLVNSTTVMQAASPAYETARLMNLVGVGIDALRIFALVVMATAGVSMFATLMSALQERRHDLALLRVLGARPSTLFTLLAAEGVTLVVAGVILGLALGHAVTEALGNWIARNNRWSVTGLTWDHAEGAIILAVLAAGTLTCLLPAIQAYRRDPAILLKR
jgi:putative ABC transport system permease protein